MYLIIIVGMHEEFDLAVFTKDNNLQEVLVQCTNLRIKQKYAKENMGRESSG